MSYKFSTQTERTNQSLHDELIAKAEAMIPVLRERSNSANSDRRIPKETIQDFKEAGFFKILQSKKYGGYELDPHTFSEVQIRVGARMYVYSLGSGRCWNPSIPIGSL